MAPVAPPVEPPGGTLESLPLVGPSQLDTAALDTQAKKEKFEAAANSIYSKPDTGTPYHEWKDGKWQLVNPAEQEKPAWYSTLFGVNPGQTWAQNMLNVMNSPIAKRVGRGLTAVAQNDTRQVQSQKFAEEQNAIGRANQLEDRDYAAAEMAKRLQLDTLKSDYANALARQGKVEATEAAARKEQESQAFDLKKMDKQHEQNTQLIEKKGQVAVDVQDKKYGLLTKYNTVVTNIRNGALEKNIGLRMAADILKERVELKEITQDEAEAEFEALRTGKASPAIKPNPGRPAALGTLEVIK